MRSCNHEFFPVKGSAKKAKGNVLAIPGLIGEKTLSRIVIPALNDEGYNVMEVDHNRRILFSVNKARAVSIRRAGEELTERSGRKSLYMIAHSKGADDAVSLMDWMVDAPKDKIHFRIRGYAAIAGIGRNGFNPGIGDVRRELRQHDDEIRERGTEQRGIFWRSVGNIVPNPLLALSEAMAASRADTNEAMARIIKAKVIGVEYEAYGDSDLLVPAPTGRSDYELYQGHHMTPLFDELVALEAMKALGA